MRDVRASDEFAARLTMAAEDEGVAQHERPTVGDVRTSRPGGAGVGGDDERLAGPAERRPLRHAQIRRPGTRSPTPGVGDRRRDLDDLECDTVTDDDVEFGLVTREQQSRRRDEGDARGRRRHPQDARRKQARAGTDPNG